MLSLQARVDLGAMTKERYSTFPKGRTLLKSNHLVSYPGHSFSESYLSAEGQSVYPTAPADWATRWGRVTPQQRCSRCILQPKSTGPLIRGVLPLCREAIGLFYSPIQRGHSLEMSYPSAEKQLVYSTAPWRESYSSAEVQSVYFTAPTDWVTRLGSLTPQQRSNRYILQPQPIGTIVGELSTLVRYKCKQTKATI